MIILFILGLLLGAVAVVFSLQNIEIVTVTFFQWSFESSLAVVLLLAIASGVVISLLILLPGTIGSHFSLRRLLKGNKKLEEEVRRQKEMRVFDKNVEPTRGDIENIEKGGIMER